MDFKVETDLLSDALFDHLFTYRGYKTNKINPYLEHSKLPVRYAWAPNLQTSPRVVISV